MNVIWKLVQRLTRGRLSTRAEWRRSRVSETLQMWFPSAQWHTITRWVRWGLQLTPLLPTILIAVATAVDSPDVANPGLEFQPGTVLASWALIATLPAFIYLSRHVPIPGHYPNCPRCLREQETLHARLEGRHACRGCGKVLTELMENGLVRAIRRAWRSL